MTTNPAFIIVPTPTLTPDIALDLITYALPRIHTCPPIGVYWARTNESSPDDRRYVMVVAHEHHYSLHRRQDLPTTLEVPLHQVVLNGFRYYVENAAAQLAQVLEERAYGVPYCVSAWKRTMNGDLKLPTAQSDNGPDLGTHQSSTANSGKPE